MLCRKIDLYTTNQQITERHIAVFATLALADMELFAIHIRILDMQIAKLCIAKTTAVEQRQHQSMLV